jgi:hypothetical protein
MGTKTEIRKRCLIKVLWISFDFGTILAFYVSGNKNSTGGIMKSRNLGKKLVFKKVTIARLDNRQMGLVFGGKETVPTEVECETDYCDTDGCNFTFVAPCSMAGEICPGSGGFTMCHDLCLSTLYTC